MDKIKWGILGTAKIACEKVIPAMQLSKYSEVYAIASRNDEKAQNAQKRLNIPFAYTSYEALLRNKDIQAVYIPLPNHLHVEWTIKALKAGKHVLCEKPMALSVADVQKIIKVAKEAGLKVSEAFMVKTHPQWIKAKQLIDERKIGTLKTIQGFFSYYHTDRNDIRYKYKEGGGGIWDIGCYPVFTSRYIFNEEPLKVIALAEYDKQSGVDILSSAILKFPSGQANFTIGTQIVPYQRMQFFGTEKMLELFIPFNAPDKYQSKIYIKKGDLFGKDSEIIEIEPINQYTIQADAFSQAIINRTELAVSLEDSLKNTAIIEALFKSLTTGKWEKPEYKVL
ncbi:MAG: Gfo/Idh/MocA family oxidoreductase [Bacteroidales bacterium]|nr:Gfo/Idh/MocA family oxidoreductase [Bacteroidales bacterium]